MGSSAVDLSLGPYGLLLPPHYTGTGPDERAAETVPAEAAATLASLPEHRREALLWRFAPVLDYDGVDDLVRELSRLPCAGARPASVKPPPEVAVLGDDGRYHARSTSGRLLCGTPRRGTRAGKHLHRAECSWWGEADGSTRPTQSAGAAGQLRYRWRTVSWDVRIEGETAGGPVVDRAGPAPAPAGEVGGLPLGPVLDPAAVPPRRRCPATDARDWPADVTATNEVGRVRAQVATALGNRCHACGGWSAPLVDHDHFSGLVRGLVCLPCNAHLDECCHRAACPWADYLNNPPAAVLQLLYPKRDRAARSPGALVRAELLGFNPLNLRVRPVDRTRPGRPR